jgi:hypothetical protein
MGIQAIMGRIDRRQKLALDEAYSLYRQIIKHEKQPELYQIAHCLATLKEALAYCESSQFKLTKRLWQRIYDSLCDLLITFFPVYIVIYDEYGEVQKPFKPITEPAIVEIHAEGLKRKCDVFSLDLDRFNPMTKARLENLWGTKGAMLNPEDFANLECGEFCAPKNFLIGDDVLMSETEQGKERAYRRWWELYWQAYCAHSTYEKQAVQNEMQGLESVWGNLYY